MVWHGFGPDEAPDASQWLFWVLPVLDPPGSEWAGEATTVLWYIRTYLWLVLLTPALLWAWRRRPAVAIVAPLVIVALDAVLGGAVRDFGALGTALVDASIFAGCWMLGFAHRDGTLRRLNWGWALLAAGTAIGAGVAWALSHPEGEIGIDLNDIPLGQALVSLGAVLLVLRYTPRLAWLERIPGLGRLITVINARAVTIYLWHNVAIALAVPLDDRFGWAGTWELVGHRDRADHGVRAGPRLDRGPRGRAPARDRPRPRPAPAAAPRCPPSRPGPAGDRRRLDDAAERDRGEPARGAQRAAPGVGLPPRPPLPAPPPSPPRGLARTTTVRVPESRRAGPSSHPGTALRPPLAPAPPRPTPVRPAPSQPVPAAPATGRRRAPEPDAVTGVVARPASGGRRRLMSFGAGDEAAGNGHHRDEQHREDRHRDDRHRDDRPVPTRDGTGGRRRAEDAERAARRAPRGRRAVAPPQVST